ncbi:potassium channel family protein [Amycolatopsis cynarae]|uniref:Potassium channel family protein n=1 Tax=Amycolatopsis cynarae TaxID=2995223 RepID=A0ABY7B0N4_9PSEU|nr:potassium channel family protein [Amycolatopsis sp. HUAS 11-8]WAL65845.1 potassium channel family protein [Amycolatopsis sp. HUAS 11-8]
MAGEQSQGVRRRQALASLYRAFAADGLLLVSYFVAPLDEKLGPVAWAKFVVALMLFASVIVFQLWAIVRSSAPRLRAVEAAAIGLPLFLVLFAASYVVIQHNLPGSFTEHITRFDSLYFTVTVFATVGLGDIAPVSEGARIIATIQMLGGLVVVGVVARLIVAAVQVARRRPAEPETPPPEDRG